MKRLNLFIERYVEIALEASQENLLLDEFDNHVRKRLSNQFKISEKDVIYLHHPFHWSFFRDKNDSILELCRLDESTRIFTVRLKKENSPEEERKLVDYISKTYGDYLLKKSKGILY
ncbi:MAG: hypothetical protein AABX88_02915 [Nanoarchaeota archaeon]